MNCVHLSLRLRGLYHGSTAVMIHRPSGVLPPQQSAYLCVYTDSLGELLFACRTVLAAVALEVFATLLYPRHICMLKGILFSLFSSSLRLISGPTVMSPQQY